MSCFARLERRSTFSDSLLLIAGSTTWVPIIDGLADTTVLSLTIGTLDGDTTLLARTDSQSIFKAVVS